MTKEELLNKTNYSLKMEDLRKFVLENPQLEDNAPVAVQRVEDSYFKEREFNGHLIKPWDVLRVEGDIYRSAIRENNKILEEMKIRNFGESKYPKVSNPSELISTEEELESYKEQFYEPSCIITDKEVVYIYSHY